MPAHLMNANIAALLYLVAGVLFIMALRFVAGAVQEMQEQEFVAFHTVRVPEWLQALGVSASWEGMGIQIAVAAAAASAPATSSIRPSGMASPPAM